MTAEEKLDEVMQERKWYGDKINSSTARSYKRYHKQRKLSKDKVLAILELLGHSPKQQEIW